MPHTASCFKVFIKAECLEYLRGHHASSDHLGQSKFRCPSNYLAHGASRSLILLLLLYSLRFQLHDTSKHSLTSLLKANRTLHDATLPFLHRRCAFDFSASELANTTRQIESLLQEDPPKFSTFIRFLIIKGGPTAILHRILSAQLPRPKNGRLFSVSYLKSLISSPSRSNATNRCLSPSSTLYVCITPQCIYTFATGRVCLPRLHLVTLRKRLWLIPNAFGPSPPCWYQPIAPV